MPNHNPVKTLLKNVSDIRAFRAQSWLTGTLEAVQLAWKLKYDIQ